MSMKERKDAFTLFGSMLRFPPPYSILPNADAKMNGAKEYFGFLFKVVLDGVNNCKQYTGMFYSLKGIG